MSRFLCGCLRDSQQQQQQRKPTKYGDEVRNPLLSPNNTLEDRNVLIRQLEGQLKEAKSSAKAEADALRRQLNTLSAEKDAAAAAAAHVRQEWAAAVREKDDLVARQAASASKIADLQAQIEMQKDIVATLQRERERLREQQQQQHDSTHDEALRQALDELAVAKAAAAALERRIDADRADIELLHAQVGHLGAAKADAEARVRELEEALAAEVNAHDGHTEELNERMGAYEREIGDMRAQVLNLKEAKLSADRCISDLETMLSRERHDNEVQHAHMAELQERVAGLGAAAAATATVSPAASIVVEATPAKAPGDAVATPLTAGSNASTDVVTPAGRAAPSPATAGSPGTVDNNLAFGGAAPASAVKVAATPSLKKAAVAALGSELDELTELQLEVVIAQLEGQLVSLETELNKNRADVVASSRMQKDYESRICDLENRLQLTTEENAHLQRFLVEVTEAMERAAIDAKGSEIHHLPVLMSQLPLLHSP